MIYDCKVCDRTLVTKATEALEDGTFPPVVSYVAKLEDSYCCADCASSHDGPGKFEQCCGTRGELGKALIFYAWSNDLGHDPDSYMHNEGWGYLGRFGRFLLSEDMLGFVELDERSSEEDAVKVFERFYADGWGAQEDDAYISEDGSVWFAGKQLNVYPAKNGETSETRRRAAVRIAAIKQGYYPNLWRDNGRGNLSLLNY
jgi:hypothetical protein